MADSAFKNETAKLGFGLMRLPQVGDDIDVEQIKTMADEFLAAGFTYFDTAYVYYNGGSERAFREAVVKRHPRDSFTIADKLPAWFLKEKGDAERIVGEMFENLGVDYIDYFLLHSMERGYRDAYDKYGCWEYASKLKEQGKIKRLGFSYHDGPEFLDEVLTEHPEVDFIQLQINYVDWDSPAIHSAANLEVARKHNKPVVVMEPVKGGLLTMLDDDMRSVLESGGSKASNASWALRFVASQPGIKMVLSGMSDVEQMRDNLATMKDFRPLDEGEAKLVKKVADMMNAVPTVPCTACCYCMKGCPMGIAIPKIIAVLNNYRRYGDSANVRRYYDMWSTRNTSPAQCIECGQCEGICPQHLEIISALKEIVNAMEDKA